MVASDIFGVSGRDDAGRADRRASVTRRCWPSWPVAGCAARSAVLEEAFTGRLHRPSRLPAGQDARPDRRQVDADIAELDAQIEAMIAPFADSGGAAG